MATERCAVRLLGDGRAGAGAAPGAGPALPFQALGTGGCNNLRGAAPAAASMASELDEYVRAAFRDKLLLLPKMPEREDDYLTSAARLLEKKREMEEVEQALLAQREEFQVKMESLQQRREELEHKEEQLKEAFFKFDKFLKENDAKRHRALRKASGERLQAARSNVEAIHLRQEIARLLRERDKLQRRLEANDIFRSYLQTVIEKTEQFQEIKEMIDRVRTLVATQAVLVQRELGSREQVEEEHAQLQRYLEESNNKVLQCNNRLAELQTQLEQARVRVHQWESKWTEIQTTAAKKTLELGQIKMAALNLFQMVTKQMKLQVDIPLEDTEAQLDKVLLCMTDLSDILADVRKGGPLLTPQTLPPATS
ncbi:cilia- and flagella-associated protein 73 [Alligator mississippiensis]|uniref:cilia- and flagella-associated protein 73 n=1 Tax=Alligator mississippiensis TaxID=8496 RepID=UPI0009075A45|nr:cilia- and flagella-associated protein 73 [Alligator mississippiensis]XP_019349259.1 cilia- and flagella-associated protein 73 [Alligator mississippiensis]XP_059569556.1 cilia- and flagella-associated protein 73 [Alligator mississippiensis]